jgi:hypothetical protein
VSRNVLMDLETEPTPVKGRNKKQKKSFSMAKEL